MMSNYNLPVPQYHGLIPAVSWDQDGQQCIESYAFNQLQSQNAALANHCYILGMQNARMQQAIEDHNIRKVNDSILSETLKYANATLVESEDRRLVVKKWNGVGNVNLSIFSNCSDFETSCLQDELSGSDFIEISFFTSGRKRRMFRIPTEKFNAKTLYKSFQQNGGDVIYSESPAKRRMYLFDFISQKLADNTDPVRRKANKNWIKTDDGRWAYISHTDIDTTQPIFYESDLQSSENMMMRLTFLLTLLLERIADKVRIDKLFFWIGSESHLHCVASLDEKPTVFRRKLQESQSGSFLCIDGFSAFAREGSEGGYCKKENLRYLERCAVLDSSNVYVVTARDSFPEVMRGLAVYTSNSSENCPVVTVEECLQDFLETIQRNPDAFNEAVNSGLRFAAKVIDEEHPAGTSLKAFYAVTAAVEWFFRLKDPDKSVGIAKLCNECLEHFQDYWEDWDTDSIPDQFREVLYDAKADHEFRFMEWPFVEEDYDAGQVVLFDEFFLYFSSALLQKIIKTRMRQLAYQQVMAELGAANIVKKP